MTAPTDAKRAADRFIFSVSPPTEDLVFPMAPRGLIEQWTFGASEGGDVSLFAVTDE